MNAEELQASAWWRLFLPPTERPEPAYQQYVDAQKRLGMIVVGVVATLLPLGGAVATAVQSLLGGGVEGVHPLPTLVAELAIVGLGVLCIAASRTRRGLEWARPLVGLVAVATTALLMFVQLRESRAFAGSNVPYILMIVLVAMPYRPLQAFWLGVSVATTFFATIAMLGPRFDAPSMGTDLAGVSLFFAAIVLTGAFLSGILYAARARTWRAQREREQLREQLAASEQKYRALFEESGDGIFLVCNVTGRLLVANPAVGAILGLPLAGVVGQHFGAFVHADDMAMVAERHRARTLGHEAPTRYRIKLRRHGAEEPVVCEMNVHRTADRNGTLGVLRDVTAQVELEQGRLLAEQKITAYAAELEAANLHLREAQAQLIQSEKMASLGNLVAGVAHEINTPVGAIHSNADVARTALEILRGAMDDPEFCGHVDRKPRVRRAIDLLHECVTITATATQRIVGIVRSLRAFARLDEAEIKQVDLHEGIDSTLTLLHHELKNRIRVVKAYGSLPRITCHPNQLNQVFMNLLTNAAQAIEGDGTITIRTRTEGDHAVLEFEDTGKGIRPEGMSRIFDPGYTTKGVGVGTGLGLAIAYRIVIGHGGTISARSEPGKGSAFTLRLPFDLPRRTGGERAA